MISKRKRNTKDKFTFSKFITVILMVLFVIVLFYAMYIGLKVEDNQTIVVSIIGAIGMVTATNLLGYQKKSQAENISKLNIENYRKMTNTRLQYERGVLLLQKEFNVKRKDIDDIDNYGDADEFMDDCKNRTINDMNNFIDDSHSIIENQTVI